MHRLTIAGILAAFVAAGFGASSGVFQIGPDTYQFYDTTRPDLATRPRHAPMQSGPRRIFAPV